MTAATCPLPDGSLCGTCPDCQADALNDSQWPDGGAPVVIPERAAATENERLREHMRTEAVDLRAFADLLDGQPLARTLRAHAIDLEALAGDAE